LVQYGVAAPGTGGAGAGIVVNDESQFINPDSQANPKGQIPNGGCLNYRLGIAAAIAANLGVCGAALAQTAPTATTACEAIASDPDRLA